MKFGVYVHIPYCLQQCPYCDFATVHHTHPTKKEDYLQIVLQEIRSRNKALKYRKVSTLYFGGGTPSLLSSHQLDAVIQELSSNNFDLSGLEEVTLEINPGTITQSSLLDLKNIGVTRFSVGAQTFNEDLLKTLGREHTVQQTLDTLNLLSHSGMDYTLDVLFGLPGQTLTNLAEDLDVVSRLNPVHVSSYCLTLPEAHPLNKNRPTDDEQSKMFYYVERRLADMGLDRYEISNFSKPGKRAIHNSLYWSGDPYWGLGMSAHSYLPDEDYGVRFWNPPHIEAYKKQVLQSQNDAAPPYKDLPPHQVEVLTKNQALTDFCHTRLRTTRGLDELSVAQSFGDDVFAIVRERLLKLEAKGLVVSRPCASNAIARRWSLSHEALVISEQVFQEMTFLVSDL